MGTKVEHWFLVTDPVGYTHRVCIDKEGTWGADNIMHFVEGTKEEKRVLLDNLLRQMFSSTDDNGEFFNVKWVREVV